MTADHYVSATSQRLIRLVEALAGNEIDGCRPSDLAKALGCSQATMTRDLANLEHAGWAQKMEESGRWRLAPRVAQISTTVHSNIARVRARLNEVEQRYSRSI